MSRWAAYGANLIEVRVKPILMLTFQEAITPFYVFQVFRCAHQSID